MENEGSSVDPAKVELNPAFVAFNKRSAERTLRANKLLLNESIRASALEAFAEQNLLIDLADPGHRLSILRSSRSLMSIALSFEPLHEQCEKEKLKNQKTSASQSKRAKKERVILGDQELPLREQIRQLIATPELRCERSSHIWPHFTCLMRKFDEEADVMDRGPLKNQYIKYEIESKRRSSDKNNASSHAEPIKRSISYPRFRQIVRELREEAGSPALD